ncbi:MAG: hypothetical protein JOZ07_02880 [Solirubrobacterales bacterium]|nr:hypothetical protein [Solirubrobacterales bacterium]
MKIRRQHPRVLLVLLCAMLALPTAALAGSGPGAGAGPGSGSGGVGAPGGGGTGQGGPPSPTPVPGSGTGTVTSNGSGISLQAYASAMLARGISFTGTAAGRTGDTIEIERSGHETSWQWTPTTHATVAGNGSFSAFWPANHIGRFAIRAVTTSSGAHAASVTPAMTITVYRPSIATWYGPGSYGTRTACGVKLTPTTLGLANRTLPCGMRVALDYQGRTLVVPVIDRGPYANGADWDLTRPIARALGMEVTGKAIIGAVSLPTG